LIKNLFCDVIVTSWWRHHDRLCDRRRVQFICSKIFKINV